MFSLRHLPPLVVATGMGLGGTMPLYSASAAMKTFGLPSSLADDPAAQVLMTIMAGRNIAFGAAIWLLYLQGKLGSVDTVLSCVGIVGLVDGWVCWREGIIGTAWFRAANGLFFGGWGVLGLTAGRVR